VDVDYSLFNLPNVLCTPHIAGFSAYWKSRLGETIVDDLERWIKGEPLKGQVTIDKYKRLTLS
jgi:phosphoglycerate dehydrogenase-like enzyme